MLNAKTGDVIVSLQGVLSYVAFAPARKIAVFAAINAFDVNGARAMAKTANIS
jgi:hypothetical protein